MLSYDVMTQISKHSFTFQLQSCWRPLGLICVAMSRRFTCGASQKKEFKFWVFPPVSLLFVLVIFFRSKHILSSGFSAFLYVPANLSRQKFASFYIVLCAGKNTFAGPQRVDVGELLPCVYSFLWTSPTIAFLIENPVLRFDTPT